MTSKSKIYYVGPNPDTARQLGKEFGQSVDCGFPADVHSGDIVFLAAIGDEQTAAELPGGNAFSACRALKRNPQVRVFLIVGEKDSYAPEIARFCLADGCLTEEGGSVADVDVVRSCLAVGQARSDIDELLAALEREIASDAGKKNSAIQRMLDEQRHDWVLDHLTDAATGLFAGPFASFKLEEEFKRATRFHQPLSLILLDLGGGLPDIGRMRDMCLAEAASVFLTASRDIDVLARFTETTFLILLPGTGSAGAAAVARRMLAELKARRFSGDTELAPSAGLATAPASGISDRGAFLARAEACLRLAQQGRAADGLCVSCE